GLQAEPVRTPVLEHLFDHLSLLVHLDRVNANIVSLEIVLGNRRAKGVMQLAQTVLQNLSEPNENRQIDAAQDKTIYQRLQIRTAVGILVRMNPHLAVFSDGEIALAPGRDVIEFPRVRNRPTLRWLKHLRSIC